MKGTLVITSRTQWEEPPRIRHQIAREMKKYFRKVLFVEVPNFHSYSCGDNIPIGIRQAEDNIFALRLPRSIVLPKNGQALIPYLSEWLQEQHLKITREALITIGAENPILINFIYSNYLYHDPDIFSFTIFLLNDDFINRAPNPYIYRLAKQLQDKTATRANLCLAVSKPLLEQVKNINGNSHLFLPGHPFGKMVSSYTPSNTEWRPLNGRIRVAFMGYINRRLDLEWIKHASSQEKIDFFLVGPNCLDKEDTKELQAQGVIFKQALKGEELFKFLASCDVLAMPYVLNPTTIAATAPNKMFQYIASGRPIVSSNMPYLLELPDGVLQKANDKEDFVQKINEAVAMDSEEHVKERFKIASENTWEIRGKELFEVITNEIYAQKATPFSTPTGGNNE